MGVFAPLVGMVGSTQAAEALKLLAGMGQPLAGRLLMLDALAMRWDEVALSRQAGCPVCGAAAH
jgi:adenylyltransferase/sulfurtransferase